MLEIASCLAGIFVILLIGEVLWRKKILKGENERKFVHISVGTFAAFWPWLISWRSIQILGILMLIGVIYNRRGTYLHYLGNLRLTNYGDVFLPVAIFLLAAITTNKFFYVIAILHVALADGLAAVVGVNYGRKWKYQIMGHTKTVLGTMTFWFVSVCIVGTAGVLAYDIIPYSTYAMLVLLLPPTLTAVEAFSAPLGMDNIVVPVAALILLNAAV